MSLTHSHMPGIWSLYKIFYSYICIRSLLSKMQSEASAGDNPPEPSVDVRLIHYTKDPLTNRVALADRTGGAISHHNIRHHTELW